MLPICEEPLISIHAPREGSDVPLECGKDYTLDFNPRSPRGERPDPPVVADPVVYFNPRSPRGERQESLLTIFDVPEFQSTLPARGATIPAAVSAATYRFQSTLPARGATCPLSAARIIRSISIHAPREGSDVVLDVLIPPAADFNPRSPRGERQSPLLCSTHTIEFQSTLPARGATSSFTGSRRSFRYFNPRSPRGERLTRFKWERSASNFNPRSPRGERLSAMQRQRS